MAHRGEIRTVGGRGALVNLACARSLIGPRSHAAEHTGEGSGQTLLLLRSGSRYELDFPDSLVSLSACEESGQVRAGFLTAGNQGNFHQLPRRVF